MVELFAEAYRLRLLRGLEELLHLAGYPAVAGVDEVGRGCLAGPVVAAAVVLDPTVAIPGVDDSKALTPERREALADIIRDAALAVSVVSVAADVIDRINILEASRRAMARAVTDLRRRPDCALVDGNAPPRVPDVPVFPLVRGDSISYSIACASILAKVERDRHMVAEDRRFPHYGFASHKGYGSAAHREALATWGPSPIHRLTFRSVLPREDDAGTGARAAGGAR